LVEKLGERRYVKFLVPFLALLVLSCAASQKKNEAEARYKVGVSHFMAGDTQAAYVKFHESIRMDPNNPDVYNALGSVHIQREEYGKAAENFRKAASLRKDYSEAYNNLCYVSYLRGEYREAIRSCERAIENPLYMTPEKSFYTMGRCYYRLGEYEKAVGAYDSSVKRLSNFSPGYYGLALAYNAMQKFGEAAGAMGTAIGFDDRFQGDKEKAMKFFVNETARTRDPLELRDNQDFVEILHY
jgi:Tfp pilus assembly protein PilF